jgi:oxygen-dependent protoporphyrinogen oxidase
VAVPLSPPALIATKLLSTRGKLRLLAEPFVRRGDASGESVAEFARRRLGREALEGLIGPFLTGVYAGDERELGAEAVFASWVEHERRFGSIALGALFSAARRRRERGWRGSWGAAQGFGPFARHLAERLVEPPTLRTRVSEVSRDGAAWRVALRGPNGESELRASRVVVAAPAHEAAVLLRAADADLAGALGEISYAPVAGVALGVDPADVRTPIDGFGFLVPTGEAPSLLGCLFMSQLFPSRAPEGRELLQCLCGGRRWPDAVAAPGDTLVARVREDLDRALGLRGEPQTLALTRWPQAIPQPDGRHARRLAGVRARLGECPGLALAGAYLEGVGVSDALGSGVRAARALLDAR